MKTISKMILTAAFAVISLSAFAQIGVGTTTPDASAALDITASNKGFLMPRMATAERTAIASPASGLQVYDTNTKSIWYFDGTVWVEQASGSAAKFVDGTNPADAVFTGGYVGIGIPEPLSLLHVNIDTAGEDAGLTLDSGESLIGDQANATISFAESGIDQWRIVSRQEASLTDSFEIVKVGQGARVSINSAGKVGIGTQSPEELLHINADDVAEGAAIVLDSGPSLSGNQANSRILFSENGTVEWTVLSRQEGSNADRFEVVEAGSGTRFTIASGGNVGIGTQSPTSKLQVVGLPVYANNAAAASAGLTNGAFYRTSTGQVMVKY